MIGTQSTRLIARAIWQSLLLVTLVFAGLEFVFKLLDEMKSPYTQYTLTQMVGVSALGLPRRLYLDLPLIVLIGVAAGLGGLAQHSALTVLRASGLSIGADLNEGDCESGALACWRFVDRANRHAASRGVGAIPEVSIYPR